VQAKKYDRAIALLVKHGWWERLLALMRSLDKISDVKPITAAVAAFRRAGAVVVAAAT
jgi:intraflagellar transport protein 122